MKIISYNTNKYDFKELVSKILEVPNLYKTHEVFYDEGFKKENYKKNIGKSLQHTHFHKKFYSQKEKFIELYDKFINEVICKLFNDSILYQAIPTFRIQAVDSLSVTGLDTKKTQKQGISGVHKDKDYNHSEKEINFFLPFTDTNEYNSIWIESKENEEDYKPMIVKYGEIAQWNGAILNHGNKINISNNSRVSIDFRVIKVNEFEDRDKSTLTQKMKFKIGDYWKKIW